MSYAWFVRRPEKVTGELVCRDQKLLGSVCRSPFMFFQTKKKRFVGRFEAE